MAEFVVGSKIKLDLDNPMNKPYKADFNSSARDLLEYLKYHQNQFTVTKTGEAPSGRKLVYLKQLAGGFYADRFTMAETSNFNATEQDLESLLNG